jgi:hypothetical protein
MTKLKSYGKESAKLMAVSLEDLGQGFVERNEELVGHRYVGENTSE